MDAGSVGCWTVPLAMLGGALRVSTPFLFVSLGECLTEKSGRVNLGPRGHAGDGRHGRLRRLVPDRARHGSACSRGHGRRGARRCCMRWLCSRPRVNDIAVGIALMVFGTGLAFFLGKPLIKPTAPQLPSIDLGVWSDVPPLRCGARRSTCSSSLGVALAFVTARHASAHAHGARAAHGRRERRRRARASATTSTGCALLATMAGGFLAGVGGSFLSLSYPGSWNEGLSSGQGLMAVALVIFARWDPVALPVRVAAVRRGQRARSGAAVGRASPPATTSSAPRRTCSRSPS